MDLVISKQITASSHIGKMVNGMKENLPLIICYISTKGSTAIHYGQQCFEGLKAYRCKDGSINLFRPDQNAKRMQHTSVRLLMPQVPTELFIRACKEVVKANQEWLGPYGSGATLYLRPFLFGTGANIGVKTAPEFIFSVFCCPVGVLFQRWFSTI